MQQASTLIPEPYRTWLMFAAETPDEKERAQHIREITRDLRKAHPELFRNDKEPS